MTTAEYLAVPPCQRRIVFGDDAPEGFAAPAHNRVLLFGVHRHNEPRECESPRLRDDRNLQAQRDAQLAQYLNRGQL